MDQELLADFLTEAGFCRAYLQPGDSGSFNIQRRTTPVSTGS